MNTSLLVRQDPANPTPTNNVVVRLHIDFRTVVTSLKTGLSYELFTHTVKIK